MSGRRVAGILLNCYCYTLLASVLPRGSLSILLLNLQVPSYVRRGEDAKLVCLYDLEFDGLYSLKWYKDGNEFYSYVPKMRTSPRRFFSTEGIDMNLEQTEDQEVYLRNVSLETEGEFRCQVSGEGPLFSTVVQTKTLRVAVIPDLPPRISGLPAHFAPGRWLHLNCTSGRSRPPARLAWTVNGEEAEDSMLRVFPDETHVDADGFGSSVLGLQFWEGKLRVRCAASIGSVYFRNTEEHVVAQLQPPERALEATASAAKAVAIAAWWILATAAAA